jgi:hypothetical protein
VPVAVFSRLDSLLQERNLTLAEVRQQIEALYGIVDNDATLEHLASGEVLEDANLNVVGAVAGLLGVSLNDLLQVFALPVSMLNPPSEPDFLTEEESRRLYELFDRQDDGILTSDEQRELDALVYDKYGKRLNDYYRHKEAKRRGISVAQVQREEDERIAKATSRLAWLESDPARYEAFVERVKQQRASSLR